MKIALGTAQFGLSYGIANNTGQIDLSEGKLLLNWASINGISMLDTAIDYGNSEQRLGEMGVQKWDIISKIPNIPKECEDIYGWALEQVHSSLHRLGVPQLYGFLLHRPLQLLEADGDVIYQALIKLKKNGLVQKIGISIYDPTELDLLIRKFDFDLVQAPFNIFDHRILDSGWLAKLSSLGVEVHTRSVFLQGLLLMAREDIPIKFERWSLIWDIWFDWLEKSGLSPVDACLQYVLSFTEISKVIVGVDNISQLNQLILASKGVLSKIPEELKVNDINLINPALWSAS